MDICKRIESLENIIKIQCSDGNWNYDPYMHGMANGLILAASIMYDKDPNYLQAPVEWLKDKPMDLEKVSMEQGN